MEQLNQPMTYRHLKFSLKRSDVYNPAKFQQTKIKYYLKSWYRFLNLIATQNEHHLISAYQFKHHWLLVLNQSVIHHNVFLDNETDISDEQYQYQHRFWIDLYPYQLDAKGEALVNNNQVYKQIEIIFYQNEYEGFASPFGIKNYQSVYEQLIAIDRQF